MKPELQRIAIATVHGFEDINLGNWRGLRRQSDGSLGDEEYEPVPDYLNSLDHMHEAEEVLTNYKQRCEYSKHLLRIAKVYDVIESHASDFNGTELDYDALTDLVHATAAQRAEAFLRTLNLWKDGKGEGNTL